MLLSQPTPMQARQRTITRLRTNSYWLAANPATKPTNAASKTKRMIRSLWLLMFHCEIGKGLAFQHQLK